VETEWQGLESVLADSPAETLPELDGLVERMITAHGYAVAGYRNIRDYLAERYVA
jgi:hypothetical protein